MSTWVFILGIDGAVQQHGADARLTRLAQRYKNKFGTDLGARIQRILIEELGGIRITIPDLWEIAKEESNMRIQATFTGQLWL